MTRRRDDSTLDLFDDFDPETGVVGYTEDDQPALRAATLDSRIAKAVSMALTDCKLERGAVAVEMTRYLGERVPVSVLNKYASESSTDHKISLARFIALIHATKDYRLLSLAAEMFGFSVVDNKYLPWIEYGQLSEVEGELRRRKDAALRQARKRGRK